jgi:hypothetical protein
LTAQKNKKVFQKKSHLNGGFFLHQTDNLLTA